LVLLFKGETIALLLMDRTGTAKRNAEKGPDKGAESD